MTVSRHRPFWSLSGKNSSRSVAARIRFALGLGAGEGEPVPGVTGEITGP